VSATIVKAGDLLYAVGPGNHAPQGPSDLCVYSTRVKDVRPEGSFGVNATPEDYARATYAIDLNDDRPVLGFPQWTYHDHDVGVKIHLSAADALRTFAEHAQQRHNEAARACVHARQEIEWATSQAHALGLHTLDKAHDLDMPPGLNDAGQHAHKIIVDYLKKHDLTHTNGCKAFYAPDAWKRELQLLQPKFASYKAGRDGTDPHLIVVYDSGDIRRVFTMSTAHDFVDEGLQAALRTAGLCFEPCSRWYSAVYSLETAP
jgi:hypothetical protein